MGKRSTFPRVLRDAYSTPVEAVAPLLPHLESNTRFIEPCCGDGCLVGHLERAGHICVGQCDLPTDASTWRYVLVEPGIILITNPPWRRDVLHPIICNLSGQAPAWLLIDAGWVHTRQSEPYLPRLRTIVSVGRVKWIKDSPFTGKDDCAWHLFDLPRPDEPAVTQFIGRTDTMRRAA
jgi:hypothetical protein